MLKVAGLFFAPDGGGGGDAGEITKAQVEATAKATAKAQKTADDAFANTTAIKETLEAMSKKVDGLNSQVGHAKRNAEGALVESEENKITTVLGELREGMKDVSKRLDGHEDKFGQVDLATMRKNVQVKFQIADADMVYLQGSSASELTESATALVERFNKVPADLTKARSNALLPTHGAPADGADPSAITAPPPIVRGEAAKRAAAMLADFQKNPGRMHG